MKLKLTILFSFFTLLVNGQEVVSFADKPVKLGFKFAINASVFTRAVTPFDGDREHKYDGFLNHYRGSGSGGVTAQFLLKKGFSVEAEALFSPRGMAYREPNQRVVIVDDEGNEEFGYTYYNYNIDYVEFPVMINYKFQSLGKGSFLSGYVGVAPATVVNRKTKVRYEEAENGARTKGRYEISSLNSVRPFNANVIGGVQVEGKPMSKLILFGDLRLNYTLMPVFDRDTSPEGRNFKTNMLTASIGFGVRF